MTVNREPGEWQRRYAANMERQYSLPSGATRREQSNLETNITDYLDFYPGAARRLKVYFEPSSEIARTIQSQIKGSLADFPSAGFLVDEGRGIEILELPSNDTVVVRLGSVGKGVTPEELIAISDKIALAKLQYTGDNILVAARAEVVERPRLQMEPWQDSFPMLIDLLQNTDKNELRISYRMAAEFVNEGAREKFSPNSPILDEVKDLVAQMTANIIEKLYPDSQDRLALRYLLVSMGWVPRLEEILLHQVSEYRLGTVKEALDRRGGIDQFMDQEVHILVEDLLDSKGVNTHGIVPSPLVHFTGFNDDTYSVREGDKIEKKPYEEEVEGKEGDKFKVSRNGENVSIASYTDEGHLVWSLDFPIKVAGSTLDEIQRVVRDPDNVVESDGPEKDFRKARSLLGIQMHIE